VRGRDRRRASSLLRALDLLHGGLFVRCGAAAVASLAALGASTMGRGAAVVRVRAPSRRRSSTVRSTPGRGRWEVSWRTSCSAMYGGIRIEPTPRPRGRPGAFRHGAECAIAVEVDCGAGPDSAMEIGHQQVLMRASRWPALALPWWHDLNSRVQS
jgi:hypothetical protein